MIEPWMSVAGASVLAALAFFAAGYLFRSESEAQLPEDASLEQLLHHLARFTRARNVAVLDQHGLLVASTTGPVDDVVAALAGRLAQAIIQAQTENLAQPAATLQLTDPSGQSITYTCTTADDRLFLITCVDAERPPPESTATPIGERLAA